LSFRPHWFLENLSDLHRNRRWKDFEKDGAQLKFTIAFLFALTTVPVLLSAQTPLWTPSVVVHASYGDGEQEYGYHNFGQSEEAVLVVSCFHVSAGRILVFDWVRKEIKSYSTNGEYLGTLKPVQKDDYLKRPLAVADILASADDIHLLVDHPGGPKGRQWFRFEIYVMDFRTGDIKDRVPVEIPELGFSESARNDGSMVWIEGTVILIKTPGGVGVYDSERGESYCVIRDGAPVAKAEQGLGRPGWGDGTRSVRRNNHNREIEVSVDGGHSWVTLLQNRGALRAVSDDSNYFVISQWNGSQSLSQWRETILDMSGRVVASASEIFYESGGNFEPGAALKGLELTTENGRPALYTVRTRASGVEIVRWGDSKE
jgi:hypothetical protein